MENENGAIIYLTELLLSRFVSEPGKYNMRRINS